MFAKLTKMPCADPLEGLEHQVELTDFGEIVLAAVGAGDLMLVDVVGHLLVSPAGDVGAVEVLDEVVGAVTGLALLAVHLGVGEAAHVTGGDPCLGIHQDRGVKADVVLVLLNELLEPSRLEVVLERHAERTVVPGVGKAAVDFGAGVYEASALAERNDFFHGFLGVFHYKPSFLLFIV